MSAQNPKIIVIDDSEIVLEVAKGALESAGFDVLTHDRAAGCVALILQEKPDLVLIDVNMPGLGGDIVVSVLTKAQPTDQPIVLLYSSLPPDVLRNKAALAGASGFISKSGDILSLVRNVNRWLKRTSSSRMQAVRPVPSDDSRTSGQRAAVTFVSLSPGSDAAKSLPVEPVRRNSGTLRMDAPKVLLVDDDMTMLSTYRRMLQKEGMIVEFALSGAQALRRLLSDTPPEVVVCDMLLPDISGIEVYQQAIAAEMSYRQRFAFATGASSMPEVAAFLANFGGPVLKKPAEPDALSLAINACLSSARRLPRRHAH